MIISRREQLVQESATHGKIAVIVDQSWAVITTISAYRVACTSPRRLGHVAQFFLGAGYPKNLFIFVLFCSASLPPALISVFQAESVEYRQPKNGEIALWSNMRVVKCKYVRAAARSNAPKQPRVISLGPHSGVYLRIVHGTSAGQGTWQCSLPAKLINMGQMSVKELMPGFKKDASHNTRRPSP